MEFRIAAVSFLNTLPLVDGLGRGEADGISLVRALPSELAAMLREGSADVALVPVVEIFRGCSEGLVGGGGIACRGAVDSVKLFSTVALEDLDRVYVDRGSRTSVALLRVLLSERHGARPEFVVCEPKAAEMDGLLPAVLVIGDRCFEFERELGRHGYGAWHCHDLGAMWFEATGLSFVFAAWALAPGFVERAGPDAVRRLGNLLAAAREDGISRLGDLAAAAAAAGWLGPSGEATAAAIAYYFSESLRFRLGPEELAGLRLFHRKCIDHGVVAAGQPPAIL